MPEVSHIYRKHVGSWQCGPGWGRTSDNIYYLAINMKTRKTTLARSEDVVGS